MASNPSSLPTYQRDALAGTGSFRSQTFGKPIQSSSFMQPVNNIVQSTAGTFFGSLERGINATTGILRDLTQTVEAWNNLSRTGQQGIIGAATEASQAYGNLKSALSKDIKIDAWDDWEDQHFGENKDTYVSPAEGDSEYSASRKRHKSRRGNPRARKR